MDLFQYYTEPEELNDFDNLTPKMVWEWHHTDVLGLVPYENIIKQSAHYSLKYAQLMKMRYNFIPPLEDSVSKNPTAAYDWAIDVLNKGVFPEGEAAIATDPDFSYDYARLVIKGEWEKGEAAIAKDALTSLKYATNVIHGRFEKGEQTLKSNRQLHDMYLDMLERKKNGG